MGASPRTRGERESRASEFRQVFRCGSVATQKCNGDYQHKNQQTQQTKLNHRRVKNAVCAFGRPCTFFGESGGFQGNHQNAPNGGNQSDDQKGSITRTCERMEIRTVCRISTRIETSARLALSV